MKKQSFTSVLRVIGKVFLQLTVVMILISGSLTTLNAQANKPFPSVSISDAGTLNDKPVLRIQFENSNGSLLEVSIRDQDQNELYTEKITDKKFNKRFLLQDVDLDKVKLFFIINDVKQNQSQVFEINRNSRTIEEYVITRL
jgi:hypothetical protein